MKNIFRHTTCLSLVCSLVCSLLLSSPLYAQTQDEAESKAAKTVVTPADDQRLNITTDNRNDSYVSTIPLSGIKSNPNAW